YGGQHLDPVSRDENSCLPVTARHHRVVDGDCDALRRVAYECHHVGEPDLVGDAAHLAVHHDVHPTYLHKAESARNRRGSKLAKPAGSAPVASSSLTASAVTGVSRIPLR